MTFTVLSYNIEEGGDGRLPLSAGVIRRRPWPSAVDGRCTDLVIGSLGKLVSLGVGLPQISRPGDGQGDTMTLDPAHLTPAASLNRVRIVDLPGVALDDAIRGKTAYELLVARTLADDVRRHADVLGLDEPRATPDTTLLPAFARRFAADAPRVQDAAEGIARRFGRSLGWLILTLKRGDAINRRARPDWDDTYWDHWAGIGTI